MRKPKTFLLYKPPPPATLSNLRVDGDHLSFTDLTVFHEAVRAVMKTTDPQLAEFLDQVGFRSEYATYQSILERAEVEGSSYAEVMTREEAKRFSVDADGELIPTMSLRSYSALLNPSGEVIINNHLHYFTDEVQVVVVDRSKAKLSAALERKTSTEDVIYNPQDEQLVLDAATLNKMNLVNCGVGFVTSIQDQHTNNNRRLTFTLLARADVDFISSNSSMYTFTLNGKVENRKKRGLQGYRFHDFPSQMEILNELVLVTRLQRVVNGTLEITLPATLVRNSNQLFIPTNLNGDPIIVSNWEENFILRTVIGPSQSFGWQALRGITMPSQLKAETFTDTGFLEGTVGCN